MKRPDPFKYVNDYYGLSLSKHSAVTQPSSGKRGQVVKCNGSTIDIQWDGEAKPRGPYHPTSDLEYPTALKP